MTLDSLDLTLTRANLELQGYFNSIGRQVHVQWDGLETFLEYLRRMKARLGDPKAITATSHKLATACCLLAILNPVQY